MKRVFLWAVCLLWGTVLTAQDAVLGTWKSIDDQTGEAKSHVQIYKKGDKVYGKIVKILTEKGDDALCDACKGKKKNQPVLGMNIIEGLSTDGERWRDGEILDPENGNTYGCVIWVPEGKKNELKVRGRHWTGLYRTQTWYRVK